MRSRGVFWVQPGALDDLSSALSVKLGSAEDPGAVRQGVGGFDLISLGSEPKRFGGNADMARGLAQVEPRLNAIALPGTPESCNATEAR